jgi:tetratricopeptide (TPR) repeat protein
VTGNQVSTAESAAQVLATLHRDSGRHRELAGLLRTTADFVVETRRKILLLTELAETYETALADESSALKVVGELLLLDPGQEWHRSWLARLATRLGAAEARVRLLLRAADLLVSGPTKARILSEAAQVCRDVLDDSAQAIDLFGQVVECGSESPELALLALEALDPLLNAEGHVEERCNVLECLAESTDDISVRQYALRAAAQLSASTLSDVERAATNWRALLDEIPNDAEALEGFIVALEAQERWQDLAQTLSYRVNLGENLPHTVPDRKRLAHIYATRLQDPEAAIAEWQSLLHDDPHDYDARDNITELLTTGRKWPQLVEHLTAQVLYADDAPTLYRRLSEVHREHTGNVRAAAEALLNAGDVIASAQMLTDGPGAQLEDAFLRLDVAAALLAQQQAHSATAVLGIQIELYGERRPKDRSVVHLALARAWLAANEPARAMAELDLAIGIDPTNGEILGLHGKVAFELGALTSAEQSYRALLLLAMHAPGDHLGLPALSVLYFRLAQIAERRSEPERADELIASAFDAALNHESQTRELEQALIEARADDLLLKTLDSQLGRAPTIDQSAEVLMDFASRRFKLGEPSASLLTRLRERADQISSTLSTDFDEERVLRAHGALVATYRLLGDPECILALLLAWSRRCSVSTVGRSLEIEAAKLMLAFPERRAEGIETLLSTWSRDDRSEDVAAVLSAALAAEGRFEELAELLVERIARAERVMASDAAGALRMELGALYERTGKLDEAVTVYEAIATSSEEHRLAALEAQSRVLGSQGSDPERRCRILDALLAMTEGRKAAEIAFTLAELRRAFGANHGEAQAVIERALAHGFAQDPTYEPVRQALVEHYRAQNQVDKARSILELAIARSPRDLRLVIELVELSEAMSDPERALEVLDSALVYLPDDPELNRRRWQLLVRAGRHEDALVVLEREYARGAVTALELASAIDDSGLSRSSRVLRFREVELLVAGRAEDRARGKLTDWIATHPDDAEAHRELARLSVKARAWEEAVGALARLVRIDTPEGSVAAALDLAIACDKIGAKSRAVESLEWAFRIAPTHEELEQRLLKSYEAVGMHEAMAKVFVARSQRVGTDKERIAALEQGAARYLLAGAPASAMDCIARAMELEPERLSLVLVKLQVLRALGRRDDALNLALEHTTSTRHAREKDRYRLFEALAELHLDEDELVEASEALAQAHRMDRSQQHIALLLGLVAADLDDIATASSALRAAVTTSRPDDQKSTLSSSDRAAAYAELARLQLLRGSQSTARQFFEKAIEEDASHHAVLQISPALQRT